MQIHVHGQMKNASLQSINMKNIGLYLHRAMMGQHLRIKSLGNTHFLIIYALSRLTDILKSHVNSMRVFTLMTALIVSILCVKYSYAQRVSEYSFIELISPDRVMEVKLKNENIHIVFNGYATKETYRHNGAQAFHGRLISSTFYNSNIYIADSSRQHIYRLRDDGTLEWVTGRRGRGPSEFLDIIHLSASTFYMFAQDRGQMKTIIFDNELNHIAEIPTGMLGIVAAGEKYTLIPASFTSDYYFEIWSSTPPFKEKGHLMKHLIPVGMQPSGYRSTRATTNNIGDFLISINGLPYLFIFDKNLVHQFTIHLTGYLVDELISTNPLPQPVQNLDMESALVQNITGGMILFDNRDILVSIRRTLYLLSMNEDSYHMVASFKFYNPDEDPNNPKSIPLGIFDIYYDKDKKEICLLSIHYEKRYCYSFHFVNFEE